MSLMSLKPSDILYSQDTISDHFDARSKHPDKKIGETLDDICEGRCSILAIPRIRVMCQGLDWITADNRRLWVFKHLERLGRCDTVTVKVVTFVKEEKMNSKTGGRTVRVRRDPGGCWHLKTEYTYYSGPNAVRAPSERPTTSYGNINRNVSSGSTSGYGHGYTPQPNNAVRPQSERSRTSYSTVTRNVSSGSTSGYDHRYIQRPNNDAPDGSPIVVGLLLVAAALVCMWLFRS